MYWLDADDGTIQLDSKSNSANNNPGNFDVAPEDSSQEDARSLSDRSVSYRRSSIEGSEFGSMEFKESGEESPAPSPDIVEAPKEEPLYSAKKKSKKSKLSAKRALFEE